jgi:O-antigen/teichoic acid export membrane protein
MSRARVVQLLRADLPRIVGVGLFMQALTLLSGPLLARMLGPTGRGEVATALSVALICSMLASVSLDRGISRFVARSGGPARDVLRPFLRGWLLWRLVPSTVACVGAAIALRNSPNMLELALSAFVITLLGTLLSLARSMVLGEQNINRVNAADAIQMITYVSCVAALFVIDRDSSAPIVLICLNLGQLASLIVAVTGLAPSRGVPAEPDTRQQVHRFARRAYFGSIGTLDRLGLDMLIIGQMLGAAALGLYAVASSIAALPAAIIGVLANPLLSKMAGRPPEEAARLLRRWVLVALAISGSAMLVLELVIDPLIPVFFGQDFAPGIASARVLLVANTAFALRQLFASAAQAQGRESAASLVTLIGSGALLAALVLGAHLGGLLGASWGIGIAATASCVALASVVSWTGRGVEAHPNPVPVD